MTLVVTGNVTGQIRGEPIKLTSRRRRLSTIVARHRPAVQRAHKLTLENGHEVVAAGAFCQLTTLTRDSVTTKVLHRWPEDA